ncbi:DUF5302 domain-containing protein [Jatrophihabitans sp.]|jgi:hypothetical protein|uniref:DUF5302 domain-containing protein n=1 Tax=Jatrophihabitans sp. TaxID=1932789 RepID=UPI002F1A8B6A
MAAEQNPSPDPAASSGKVPGEAESTGSAGAAPDADPADVKARFRDALQRKKSQHADGVGGSGPNAAKIRDVHTRAGGKRQFRRKSGG